MKVLNTVQELLTFRGKISDHVGFVPTMGALHEGHLSLIAKSKAGNPVTGCSIFVNPIQFNNSEDFEKYPKTLDRDLELLKTAGCDFVFVPSANEMYPSRPTLKFDFGELENIMEGAFRPGHFNGVAVVVSKLFHFVDPSVAYFGRKDLQQTVVIKKLAEDLGFTLKIIVVDTLRDPDGLAMSSRNVRLSAEHRLLAPILYQTLIRIQTGILNGNKVSEALISAKENIQKTCAADLEYLEIVNADNLQIIDDSFNGKVAICIAAYLGNVRLIDNVIFDKA